MLVYLLLVVLSTAGDSAQGQPQEGSQQLGGGKPPKGGKPDCVPQDSDSCLQGSAGWGASYMCSSSTQWCDSWGKDLQRCCPESCGTGVFTEAECNSSPAEGTCTYPNDAQCPEDAYKYDACAAECENPEYGYTCCGYQSTLSGCIWACEFIENESQSYPECHIDCSFREESGLHWDSERDSCRESCERISITAQENEVLARKNAKLTKAFETALAAKQKDDSSEESEEEENKKKLEHSAEKEIGLEKANTRLLKSNKMLLHALKEISATSESEVGQSEYYEYWAE